MEITSRKIQSYPNPMKPIAFPLFASTARGLRASSAIVLTCASLLGSAALSQADVIASDDFTDSIDAGFSSLIGKGGGTGFSSNWTEFSGYGTNIYNPAGTALGISPARRDLSVTIGDTGSIWVSFDWSCQDDTNGAGTGASQEWGTFSFFNGAAEIFAVGNPYQNNTWRLQGVDSGISNVGTRKTGVIEFTLGAGATDSAKLWVGPTGSPVDVSGAAAATVSGFDLNGVNAIRIMGPAEQTFDNLLIGETVADVAATDTPPTPTSGTWTNAAGGTWNTAGNWLSDTVATGSDSTANFNTLDITADTTVTLNSARTIGNLVFGDTDTATAASWTLTGNTLTLAGTTPTITVNALGTAKTVSISAAVGGSAGLTKAGPGTLTLSAANTYTGLTDVTSGTLQLQGGAFSNTARDYAIASGAVLNLDGNTGVASGTTTLDGTGTLRITGGAFANESPNEPKGDGRDISMELDSGALIDVQSGASMYNGGWQNITWTNNLADMNADGAFDLAEGQNVYVDALTGAGSIGGANFVGGGGGTQKLTVGVAGDSGTFSGNISGGIGFTKTGDGSQTLSGTNTYSGNTIVEDGTLSIPSGGSLRFFPTTDGQTNSLTGTFDATLSYLGTVDLDLSATNISDGNFWNLVNVSSFSGPTPTFTPEAVTSTLGSFTENSPGTWGLSTAGVNWTFTEADGTLYCEVTATPYELWANSFDPAIGLPAEDDDNDGVTNFEEYAFGLLPNNGASVNPIAAPLDKAAGTFSYTRRSDSGMDYSVWFSENLDGWTEDTLAAEGTPVPNGDNETVEVTLSVDPLPAKLFIQVRAD
jgi:autotransporter-associated beta strand protein